MCVDKTPRDALHTLLLTSGVGEVPPYPWLCLRARKEVPVPLPNPSWLRDPRGGGTRNQAQAQPPAPKRWGQGRGDEGERRC